MRFTLISILLIAVMTASVAYANPDKDHWAFQPVVERVIPSVENSDWPLVDIDRFVLARLESAEIEPSVPADRRTWLRRAKLGLLGLPPTEEELGDFLSDDSPEAFDRVVDRLLASPRYGERWGRHWLDVARYADNKGYVFFEEKTFPWAYTFRDWVVRAFNEDLPYDRFVTQQVAADQTEHGADRRALAAMGFLTLGGRFMNNLHDVIDDRIDVVTRGFMGLTVTCARCHAHKYDPVTQEDYYALYGVFRSSVEPTLRPIFETTPKTEEYKAFAKELRKRVAAFDAFVAKTRAAIAENARQRVGEYLVAVHAKRGQPDTVDFMLLAESGALNPYMIHRWEAYLASKQDHPVWSVWHRLGAIPKEQFAERSTEVLTSMRKSAVVNRIVLAAFEGPGPASIEDVANKYSALLNRMRDRWEKLQAGANPPSSFTDPAEEELRRVFYAERTPSVIPEYFGWGFLALLPDRAIQAEYKKLLGAIEKWSITGKGAPPRAMVLVDSALPYDPKVFVRGNPSRPAKAVPRRFLSILSDQQPFQRGSGRLELARAIVHRDNPLTARVIVNRIWQQHFGVGLVQTASDFGVRGSPPSHPELLDHLARTFVDGGWSIKALHRHILLSATYRQTSAHREIAHERDPENRLLWRFPRRRLEFEAQRDALLFVADGLDDRIGGKAAPLGETLPARRTIYGFVDRMDLPNLLRLHDFPDPAASSPGRDRTTVAPQALYLMNNDFVQRCAERVVGVCCVDEESVEARVVRIFRRLFVRDPTASEKDLARRFMAQMEKDAWTRYVHALLMTNEFVFVD